MYPHSTSVFRPRITCHNMAFVCNPIHPCNNGFHVAVRMPTWVTVFEGHHGAYVPLAGHSLVSWYSFHTFFMTARDTFSASTAFAKAAAAASALLPAC